MHLPAQHRVFKSAWFAKAARKAHIADDVLCRAIAQVVAGQADDLGGGVFKKRLNDNRHRSIILACTDAGWIYQYLFAKQDRPNINNSELQAFRKLALAYAQLTPERLNQLLRSKDLVEICHDRQTPP